MIPMRTACSVICPITGQETSHLPLKYPERAAKRAVNGKHREIIFIGISALLSPIREHIRSVLKKHTEKETIPVIKDMMTAVQTIEAEFFGCAPTRADTAILIPETATDAPRAYTERIS